MKSSNPHIDKRRRVYVRLIGEIQHALNQALHEEHQKRGLTCSEMARLISKDKSFVSRKLSGMSNMTLETFADLVFALDRSVKVLLPARGEAFGSNHVLPQLVLTHSGGTNQLTTETTSFRQVGFKIPSEGQMASPKIAVEAAEQAAEMAAG